MPSTSLQNLTITIDILETELHVGVQTAAKWQGFHLDLGDDTPPIRRVHDFLVGLAARLRPMSEARAALLFSAHPVPWRVVSEDTPSGPTWYVTDSVGQVVWTDGINDGEHAPSMHDAVRDYLLHLVNGCEATLRGQNETKGT